ncbi:MAG: peptidylprolyl isomerase [Amylibacter sp.]
MKIARFIASSTLAVFMATTAIAQNAPTAQTVVATVNGQDITVGHVIALASRLPERFQQLPDADLFKGVMEQLIQQTTLSVDVDVNQKAIQLAIENETRALLASEALTKIEDAATTEELIEKAYGEQYTDTKGDEEYRAAHILVKTEDEAKELVTTLEGGADFSELAKEKSTGPSGPRGGDLGWFSLGQMVPEFEQAVVALEPGTISTPVKTQFGWHVMKLNEKREKPKPTLVEVRAQLMDSMKTKAVGDHIEKLQLTADIQRVDIEIDPSVIRNTDMLND